jgi:hypothetical protein
MMKNKVLFIGDYVYIFLHRREAVNFNMFHVYKYYKREEAKIVFGLMIQGGIIDSWILRASWRAHQRNKDKKGIMTNDAGYHPMPLTSHIKIIFYWWLIGLGISFLAYAWEKRYSILYYMCLCKYKFRKCWTKITRQ